MRGIDLSHWNGQQGLDILRDDSLELDFCIAKHSEGEKMMDSRFDDYLTAARERGMMFGGYYFYVGNVFTDERSNTIINRIDDMLMCGGFNYYPFIDWEREIDRANANFIFGVIESIKQKLGVKVGLYASYSVFKRTGLAEGTETVAKYCREHDIPIWCARYKCKDHVQGLSWGNNAVPSSLLQKSIDGTEVELQQITSKCFYRGVPIDLDYNVAFRV